MTGDEFRERIRKLGIKLHAAAPELGLSTSGLHHQLNGHRPVSRQTELLLQVLEQRHRDHGPLTFGYTSLSDPAGTWNGEVLYRGKLKDALRDLDFYIRRFANLDDELAVLLRGVRVRLLVVTERSEPIKAETVRRNLRPRPVK